MISSSYDKEVDALYIRLKDNPIHRSYETTIPIVIDLDSDGNVTGIEILDTKSLNV